MPLETWLAFFAAAWLISLSPGAGAVSCMAAGMRYGFARAFWNIFGLQLGILLVLALVATGLGALLAASAVAFAVVKWLGVAYLAWLGIAQWRAAPTARIATGGAAIAGASPRQLFARGFLINATNPKAIIFMLAVLPQFIDPLLPLAPQYLACAATLFFTDLVVMSGYTLFAARSLRYLENARHLRAVNRLFGTLFVGAGVWLATFRRAA